MRRHARRNGLILTLFGGTDGGVADTGGAAGARAPENSVAGAPGKGDQRDANRTAFERMIKGAYKDAFAERTQQIIDSRFKDAKELKARMDALSPVLNRLAERYGVSADDPAALLNALDAGGEAVVAKEGARDADAVSAPTEGTDTAAGEPKRAPADEARARRYDAANRMVGDWVRQGQALLQTYPWFDLSAEAANPYTGRRFLSLLKSRVPVRAAYELIHRNELLGNAMRYTARKVRQQTVEDIRTRGLRPEENGAHGQGAAQMKRDIRSLSRQEREEIARRAARGERITL